MISGKDIWFEAWDKYYAKCDDWMQDIKNDDMTELLKRIKEYNMNTGH